MTPEETLIMMVTIIIAMYAAYRGGYIIGRAEEKKENFIEWLEEKRRKLNEE